MKPDAKPEKVYQPHPNDAPAGNAIHDPAQQTHRKDMPDEEQHTSGKPGRGSLPADPDKVPQVPS